jgi:NAD-dependent DNA ligase
LVQDDDAAEIVVEASAGHSETLAELLDLLTLIAEVRAKKIDASCRRSSANRILGFCAGVNCDALITTREAELLVDRLKEEHDLEHDPRVAALRHFLVDALQDQVIEPSESAEISNLISTLVGDSYADTGIPSSEAIPVIQDIDEIDETCVEGKCVVLTGGFAFGTRAEVADRLSEFGAQIQKSPTKATDIVVIGTDGSPLYTHKNHGGKLAKALDLRAKGPLPRIYLESQLRRFFASS